MKKLQQILVGIGSGASHAVQSSQRFFALLLAAVIVLAVGTGTASAQATPPVDLSTSGTDIASFIPTAAGWALPIFVGMVGLAIVLRAFRRTTG